MTHIHDSYRDEISRRKISSIPNTPHRHWAELLAQTVVETFPDEEVYTCAAGITPSGIVHFGNFRDIMTNYAVIRALRELGKNARLVFSWDDFDRFRKVPAGVPSSFEQYIGMPVSRVPDPHGEHDSYARRFESELEEALTGLNIDIEYRYQTQMYSSGMYVGGIRTAFQKRHDIARILLDFMSEKSKHEKNIDEQKFIETYYPGAVYSPKSGRDTTEILAYDGDTGVTYRCLETDTIETIDFSTDHHISLRWKTDWPMRWLHENVHFEPGGFDHGTPGGSYDTSTIIARDVFSRMSPIFVTYQFIGIRGLQGKMSGSKGNAVTPQTLLEIYTSDILKWLYLRKLPTQSFELAFDSEIIRQYEEFDREKSRYFTSKLNHSDTKSIQWSHPGTLMDSGLRDAPFRQIASFGQIVQWDSQKMMQILANHDMQYDPSSVSIRLEKSKAWLQKYNSDQKILLLDAPNRHIFASLEAHDRGHIQELRTYLIKHPDATLADMNACVYSIPKDDTTDDVTNKANQRAFFRIIYQLLIGCDIGPRLSTFLWAVDRERVLLLLNPESGA